MNDPLIAYVKEFLRKQLSADRGPLLLGFSGGGDSLALLHLLLECGQGKNLHLAHVDHGWREESSREAEALSLLAKKLGLPFHLRTLEKRGDKNLEAQARDARIKFFSEIYAQIGSQALLLAHHADDQAETVLKRVLEGAHFLALGGIKEVSSFQGMQLLRPLLSFPKKLLNEWLEKRGERGIEDATNRDPAFLRARLRTQILPSLAESFGKEISSNLVRLGRTMEQIEEMIAKEVEKTLEIVEKGPLGLLLEIPETQPRLLRSAVVKRFLEKQQFFHSYETLETICQLLESKAANRLFLSRGKRVVVDRGILFLLPLPLPNFSFREELKSGSWFKEGWEWELKLFASTSSCTPSSWRDLWRGEGQILLPEGEFQILPPEPHLSYPGGSSLNKWWTDHRIPAFLRPLFPLIAQNGEVVHEFLSGRKKPGSPSNSLLQVCLKLKLTNN